MPSPSVHVAGFRGVGAQCDLIEEGFRALGWKVVENIAWADLIYVNDSGGYDRAIAAKHLVTGKVIFNVLDLAKHIPSFPLAQIKERLTHADAVTTISKTVQEDIKTRLGLDAHLIYNPIRPITRTDQRVYPYRAMFVGRVQDPAKRAYLGASALGILGVEWEQTVTVGREAPPYGGIYFGTATDEQMNDLYNSVDFVMFPSSENEGWGMPVSEAMAAGVIPVVCNDLCTRQEMLPSSVFPEYDEVEPTAPSIARFMARFMNNGGAMAEFKDRLHAHYREHLEHKLSPRGVATAIEQVYLSL